MLAESLEYNFLLNEFSLIHLDNEFELDYLQTSVFVLTIFDEKRMIHPL